MLELLDRPPACRHRLRRSACSVEAFTTRGRSIPLDWPYDAPSPRLALRWMRWHADRIADQLDEPYAEPVRQWLQDEAEQQRAQSLLADGQPYTFTVPTDDADYVVSARPSGTARPASIDLQGGPR